MTMSSSSNWRHSRIFYGPSRTPCPDALFMDITPEMALEALGHMATNRRLSPVLARKYARQMANGEWRLTHQGIAFDTLGACIDGQHRLRAIVIAMRAVRMLVVTGLESSTMVAIDAHRARSETDRLRIAGNETENLRSRVALLRALVEMSLSFEQARMTTTQEIADLLEALHDEISAVIDMTARNTRGTSHSCYRAALLSALLVQPDDEPHIRRFATLVSSGVGAGSRESAAIRLREYLLVAGTQGGSSDRQQIFLRSQRALKAFLDGQGILRLYAASRPIWDIAPLLQSTDLGVEEGAAV